MRIKEVGATINLGNYSSLHVTIGEPSDFAGLDIGRAEKYLRNIAKSVNGMLNLPEETEKEATKTAIESPILGEKIYSFASTDYVYYDHASHQYTSESGVKYCSVTQMLENFYPFESKDVIKKEYMDFASSFGNVIHTAVQNAVIGMSPKKELVKEVVEDALKSMLPYDGAFVEQVVLLPEQELAGRFDILTIKDGETTLWDVKTNSEIYKSNNCTLPDSLKEYFGEYWNPNTIYGEHCLQLNIYAHMIEKTTDYKVDNIKIIHIPDNFNGIINVPKVDVTPIFQAFGAIR